MRFAAYPSSRDSASAIDSGVNAATAASCGSTGGQMVKLPVRRSTARLSSRGTSIHPSRQPVIAKYFEKLFITTDSREVSHAQLVAGAPGYTSPWYTSSLISRTPDDAHQPAIAASSSGGITVPVGLAGLATTTPATGGSSSVSIASVGWNRVSGPHGNSTTSQPSAVRMLR